jgi:hypothetical protein
MEFNEGDCIKRVLVDDTSDRYKYGEITHKTEPKNKECEYRIIWVDGSSGFYIDGHIDPYYELDIKAMRCKKLDKILG